MSLQPQQQLCLCDLQGRNLGQVLIEQIQGDLVFGRFVPGPDYPEVERLFADYVEAANDQLLSVIAELDTAIAALGLHLSSDENSHLPAIDDVQIGAGGITFRIRKSVPEVRQSGEVKLPIKPGSQETNVPGSPV